MKTTGWRVWSIAAVTFLFLAGSPLQAQPDKIILDRGGKTRPAVTFPHMRHIEAGFSCKDCHHVYENGKNILEEDKLEEGNQGIRCSACHGSKSRLDLEQAFHNQCIGCHTTYLKKKEKTTPRYCGECHIK
jgi:hypothetical protein